VNDARKTKRELLEELADLRRQLAERHPPKAGPHRPDLLDGLPLAGPACYADLFEGVPDGVSVVDPQGRFVYANRTVVQRLGVPPERLIGTPLVNMMPPVDRDRVVDQFHRALRGETVGPFEQAYRTPDDRTVQLQVTITPIRAGSDVVGLLGITRDVTQRRLTEAECERAARELTLILDGVAEHVIFHDPSMQIVRASQAAAESVGFTPEEMRGRHCYELWHGRDVPCEGCPVQAALETGEPHRAEMTTTDGRVWDVRGRPVYDGDGTLLGAVEVTLEITDRRRAEEALRQSERFLQTVFDGIQDGITVRDRDLTLLRVNRWIEERFADQMPLVGKKCYRVLQQRDTPCPWCPAIPAMETGEVHRHVVPYPSDAEARGRFEVTAFPLVDAAGEIVGAIEHVRDVTDRFQTEEALRQSEANYRAIFNAVHDMVFVHDIDTGDVVDMNRRAAEAYGYGSDELDGLNAHFRRRDDPPYTYGDQMRWLRRAAEEGPQLVEWLAEDRDGRTFWVEVGVRRATIGGTERLLAVLRDITERRRAEEALRQSEARYRAVVEAQTELVCRFRPDHTLTFVNAAYARYFGKRPEDLIGTAYVPLIAEEDRDRVRRTVDRISAEDPVVTVEERVLQPDGEVRWQQWTSRGIFDDAGNVVEYQGVGRDITERKRAEDTLRRSEEAYRALFEESLDGIAITVGRRIVRASQALARLLHLPVEAIRGRDSLDFVHPDERATAADRIARRAAGEPQPHVPSRYRILQPEGPPRIVEVLSRCVDWQGQEALQTIFRDVTEQVRLQEQLQQALKMEAIGQLAGGIAHDFNNLMTGILCHAGLLKTDPAVGDAVRETAELIEGAARRAAELTSQLLGFARRGKQQDVPVDLGATVAMSVRLLSQSLPPVVIVETDFREPRAYVRGDPVQMEQVVLNLAMNARDAMPDGGTVTFTVERRQVDADTCRHHAHAEPGSYTVLTVADTGVGIPKEQHSRVFEPFFTTKPQGKGTGMGLAMVYGIVRNHGGWIDIESEPGEGTAFRVFLPAVEAPAEEAVPTAPADAATAADRSRILIVDDEELVRDVVSRMIARLGYEPVAVASGQEAIDIFRESGEPVAAVIIDFRMPGMDGQECFRALKALDPQVRAVLATGGGTQEPMQDLLDEGVAALVKKPFEIDGLDATLRRVLGA